MLFRNDDVDHDTDAQALRQINAMFARHGLTQLHAVTVRGISTVPEGAMSRLDNAEIIRRGEGKTLGDNPDLVEHLSTLGTDHIALHGLYHVSMPGISYGDQRQMIEQGLEELRGLLPGVPIDTFVPPFDRYDDNTLATCQEVGLRMVSHPRGLNLDNLIRDRHALPRHVRRYPYVYYHHKRYYPNDHVVSWRSSLAALEDGAQWIVEHESGPTWLGWAADSFSKLAGRASRHW